ncbi:MAG: L,D-transpeptidase [Chloroflexi bacterium]|nr:L,D-transpeptidase [Chloroflexota bacterium]
MTKSTFPVKRSFVFPLFIIIIILAVVSVAAWTATSSPALGLYRPASPTHARLFAVAQIAKPTYTSSPTALPTATPLPTELPTNTPIPTVYAEILVDTPTAEYTVPQPQAPSAQDSAAAASYGGNKYILVDISEQHMYVYEGDLLVYSFVASTGMNNATRVGMFSVQNKIPNAYGATWDIWMPNWLGIYWAGGLQNGIHALPILPNGATLWAGYLGVPISYGCVVLGSYEAQLLYDWADIGTPVEIRW